MISRQQHKTPLINERTHHKAYISRATLNEKWECDEEVNGRAEIKNLLLTVPNCYVRPIVLNGVETGSQVLDRIEAFELWILPRVLHIPWTAYLINEAVSGKSGVGRQLLDITA